MAAQDPNVVDLMENEPGGDDNDGNDKQKKEKRPAGCKELALRLACVGNFGLQAVSIAYAALGLNPKFLTKPWPSATAVNAVATQVGAGCLYGSAGVGAINTPVVIYKERQLTNEDTFRAALNGIREQQGRLTEQNDILSAEIDDLQSEVDRMKDIEMALRELSETQGSQLDELMSLIDENKIINKGMRVVLKSKTLEEVITLVLDMDNDGSFTIEDKEIERLIAGISLIDGVSSFDKSMFREEVAACDGDLDEVIAIIKAMILGIDSGDAERRNTRCTIEMDDPETTFERMRSSKNLDSERNVSSSTVSGQLSASIFG
mmetsp:Transcript_3366/g.6688  ORF Transcript_3366/g.6688 Transcript_3366/m.6688 type:complete len:319 (+) Transcript_3366:1401-2357(+)